MVSILNNINDEQWKLLKQVRPSQSEKAALKARLSESIRNQSFYHTPKRSYQWKALFATCVFILICSGFIYKMIQTTQEPQTAVPQSVEMGDISWDLKDVSTKKTSEGWEIYRKNVDVPVGTIDIISEEEKDRLSGQLPMFVKTELKSFPYETIMNIEHVKTMDTIQRYHFFIPLGNEKMAHFTFDYPKLEYAEIFQAMKTLTIDGIKPKNESAQLYVKHGYGNMLFPVGLEPISITNSEEIYHWENATLAKYNSYLEEITKGSVIHWKKESENGQTTTFVSANDKEIVTITLDGKRLIYEFTYLYEE